MQHDFIFCPSTTLLLKKKTKPTTLIVRFILILGIRSIILIGIPLLHIYLLRNFILQMLKNCIPISQTSPIKTLKIGLKFDTKKFTWTNLCKGGIPV